QSPSTRAGRPAAGPRPGPARRCPGRSPTAGPPPAPTDPRPGAADGSQPSPPRRSPLFPPDSSTNEVRMIKRSRSGPLLIRRPWPSFHPSTTTIRTSGPTAVGVGLPTLSRVVHDLFPGMGDPAIATAPGCPQQQGPPRPQERPGGVANLKEAG